MALIEEEWELPPVTVQAKIGEKSINALVDSGADESYIHWKTVAKLNMPTNKKKEPYKLHGIGGKEVSYNKGTVMHETSPIAIFLNGKKQREKFDITELGEHQLILGRRWL